MNIYEQIADEINQHRHFMILLQELGINPPIIITAQQNSNETI